MATNHEATRLLNSNLKGKLIAVAVFAMAACAVWLIARQDDPLRYHGHTLAFWLQEHHRHFGGRKDEAPAAVENLGTNNVDLLLKWFQEPEPPYKPPIKQRIADWISSKQSFYRPAWIIRENYYPPSHCTQAGMVFMEFPVVTKLAAPQLAKLLASTNQDTQARAAICLKTAGATAVPYLLPLLSSENITNQGIAFYALASIKANPEQVIPALRRMLTHTNVLIRLCAIHTLLAYDQEPDEFLPSLLSALESPTLDLHLSACYTLTTFTNVGKLLIPQLKTFVMATTNQSHRQYLVDALRTLDRDAVTNLVLSPLPDPGNAINPHRLIDD